MYLCKNSIQSCISYLIFFSFSSTIYFVRVRTHSEEMLT